MLFKSYIPGNDTFVFILNLDISRPVLHSTFDIQMGKIDIDNMSSVYIYLPLFEPKVGNPKISVSRNQANLSHP